MSVPLIPIRTFPGEPLYQAVLEWPWPKEPFYVRQVVRLLREDIPFRVLHRNCRVWVYRDSENNIVGIGTFDIWPEYPSLTGGLPHAYIPVLAVHPEFPRRGHGQAIVEHLRLEAMTSYSALWETDGAIFDKLLLDVYKANQAAVSLYVEKCGFDMLNPDTPECDPDQNNEPFFILAKRLSL